MSASSIMMDVYCSNEKVQSELRRRLQQASPMEDVLLQWQSLPSSEDQVPTLGHAKVEESNADGCKGHQTGTQGASSSSSFAGQQYMATLNKHGRMGQVLLAASEMTSTQEFMRGHLAALGDGVVLVADRQTAGKGRGGNVWTSPAGCLMFSCSRLLRVPPNQAPFINYIVCLGVVNGIHDAVAHCCGLNAPRLPIAIKWPNDVYFVPPASEPAQSMKGLAGQGAIKPAPSDSTVEQDGKAGALQNQSSEAGPSTPSLEQLAIKEGSRDAAHSTPSSIPLKIAGALIHTTWSRDRFNVVTGIGLNLSNPQPTTCLNAILEHSNRQQDLGAKAGAEAGSRGGGVGNEQGVSSTDSGSMNAAADPLASMGKAELNQGSPCPRLSPEIVLAHVMNCLDKYFEVFEEHGFAPLEADYIASWLHSGQQVQFLEHEERSLASSFSTSPDQQQPSVATLIIEGLSPSGFLMAVETSSGRRFELTPDGNSLDMMAGLIRRKLPA